MLFSTDNGAPLAMLNDGHLQHMRVGGAAGLGTRLLAREDSHVVGMIGSGGMAQTFLEALIAVRDIRRVRPGGDIAGIVYEVGAEVSKDWIGKH